MKVGPRYKIARRLGAPVFDKTQTQKFEQALQRKSQRSQTRRRRRTQSEYGMQLREKQKARYIYLMRERQFSNYVKNAMSVSGVPSENLYRFLEMRLDNVAYRMGLAPTKHAAKQLVSHGHVTVNGVRSKTPSHRTKVGDLIAVREQSKKSKLFDDLNERLQHYTSPSWISFDEKKLSGKVEGQPQLKDADLMFDIQSILEFYSR